MATISPEVLRQLVALYGSGGAGQPREYYDAASGMAYVPQYGAFATPDGRMVGSFGLMNGNEGTPVLSGFEAYEWAPGRYQDNVEMNGLPKTVYDASGQQLYGDTWSGLKNMDTQNIVGPLAIAALPFAASALMGAGAGAAGGAAGAGGGSLAGGAGLGTTGASLTGGIGTAGAGTGFGLSTLPELGGAAFGSTMESALAGLGAAGSGGALAGADLALSPMGAGGELPAMETVSEGFGPAFEQSVANGTWQIPSYPADYGTLGTAGAGAGLASTLTEAAKAAASSAPSWLGPAATLAGGLLGAKGQENSSTAERQLPSYLQGPVADVVGRAQGLLALREDPAQQLGRQQYNLGSEMLANPVAGNGYGQITLNAPTTASNPYLSGMADDITRRTQEMLDGNNLAIQGRYAGMAGTGNSRQGVAQGVAAGKAADYLSGNLANLYGQQYSQDQNRALQQYGMDQGFYTSQRGQDLMGLGVGSDLITQGMQTQWLPLQNASDIYGKFSGFGPTTQTSQQGGGWGGGVGGLMAGAAFGKQMGWWG